MAWKACPETFPAYTGDFPKDGSFDIGNLVNQPASECNVIGNNVFWGYHGEFWKNSQTGMLLHYNDQGLLLGLWGVLGPEVANLEACPGICKQYVEFKVYKSWE